MQNKKSNFSKNSVVKKLCVYGKKYLPFVVVAFILAILGAVLSVMGPKFLSKITTEIQNGIAGSMDFTAIKTIGTILLTIYLLSFLFNYTQSFIMATVAQKISYKMREDLSKKINKIPLSYFDTKLFGDTLSRITNDVDSVSISLNGGVSSLISAIVQISGSIIMMFATNWIMALAGIIAAFIGFILMIFIMKKSQKYFALQQAELANINSIVEESFSGHLIIKAYNNEENVEAEFDEKNEKLYNNAWKAQFMSTLMMPLMSFIGNLGYVAVCITGAILAINGSITIATIVAFIMYINLFITPLSSIAQATMNLQSAISGGGRVFEFLEEKEMEEEVGKIELNKDIIGKVEFTNVKFGYNQDKLIIKNFNQKVKAGQKVAIVGPTGAGKTTMVNLLMKFYNVNEGEILIDDTPISTMTRKGVHDLFSMVLQDTWIFEGSIKENLLYTNVNTSQEELDKACRAVGLYEYIHALPDGYDTILNENVNLSAGQKQLITIARAMLKNAPLLILDEATSSVDTRTEKLLQESMDYLSKGKTSFVIAHRLSTIKNVDLILVMKDGDIIETGNHDELMTQKGFYAELYNSQFDNA